MTRDEMIEVMWNAMVNNPNRDIRVCIRAALSAIEAAGLCIVPREATEEAIDEIRSAYRANKPNSVCGMTIDAQWRNEYARELAAYRAMIEAGRL